MAVIAFEGLDGVGKSTLSRAVSIVAGGVDVTAQYGLDAFGRSWVDAKEAIDKGIDVDARFEFYRRVNQRQMMRARHVERAGRLAVLDSSVYRTVATHRELGSAAAWLYRLDAPESHKALLPDYGFYLNLDEDERRARLRNRDHGIVYSSRWDQLLDQHQQQLRGQYSEFELIPLEADLAVPALVRQVLEHVRV